MNKKNNNFKRSFIPKSIGDTIKKINKNYSAKFGKIEFIIQSKWSEIVGSYFAVYSEPKYITKLADHENELGEKVFKNLLNVSVAPAAAVEFQHFHDKIVEKINSYFGYKAIKRLRIHQNYIPKEVQSNKRMMSNLKVTNQDKEFISSELKKLQNDDLKNSLIDLGENIVKEEK